MGHILFAAPGIRRYHLHERLARELRTRGHRVTVLCTDAVEFGFWSAQAMATLFVRPTRPEATRAPLRELAQNDCLLAGRRPTGPALRRAERRLQRLLPGCRRWLETDAPDLVLLHGRRGGAQALLHFLARECGSRVLWCGDGLLPHTMQIDSEGLDGDAAAARRTAFDYRWVRPDRRLLDAALAALLARTLPVPLTRKPIQMPPVAERLRHAAAALFGGHRHGVLGAYDGWRAAAAPGLQAPTRPCELPAQPFLTVLLQDPTDARVRLDAGAAPAPSLLVRCARAAATQLDSDLHVVAVLPPAGLPAGEMSRLRRLSGVSIEFASAAPDAAAAAAAVVTINHPLGIAAALAGTPIVHLGRALYGLPGVAVAGRTDRLLADLRAALAEDDPELRERFLTWLLAHGHIWCSPDFPDHNGITGMVLEIETRMQERNPAGLRLRYRTGPAWPLATEGLGA